MNDVLFESIGANKKRDAFLKICGNILIICGFILFLLGIIAPSYVSGRILIIVVGICSILLGVYFIHMPSNDYTSKAYLRIYNDHIEGRQVSPDREFSLNYNEIFNVKRMEFFANEFLIIESGTIQYSVLVEDMNTAYEIISSKLDELEKI